MHNFLDQFLNSGTIFAKNSRHFFVGYGKRIWGSEPFANSPSWYFPDFFLKDEQCWFTHQYWEVVSKDDFLKRLPESRVNCSLSWSSNQVSVFEDKFSNLKEAIAKKLLFKGVPYFFQTNSITPNKDLILHMLRSSLLYAADTSLQNYGFWDENEGLLGATPELLFSQDSANFKTMACAGTVICGQKMTIQEEKKLLKEHRFVIEGISDAIGEFGSSLMVGQTHWHTFQNLKHLLTPIEMRLYPTIKFLDLVQALHPTAAIGTYPKVEGQKWLSDYDVAIPRQRFGAPCACAFQKETLCLVAIRNVQWDKTGMKVGAGSGVIEESCLDKEKYEIEMKINAIKRMLQL